MPGEDTLHRVVSGVARGGGAGLIARRTEVIVVTYQALVPAPTEIGLQACITAYTCNIWAHLAIWSYIRQTFHRIALSGMPSVQ